MNINYIDIFHPNGMSLDGCTEEEMLAYLKNKSQKYNFVEKGLFISALLKKYSIASDEVVKRIKKCLPNGYNKFHSYTDVEYEELRKEFPDISIDEVRKKYDLILNKSKN